MSPTASPQQSPFQPKLKPGPGSGSGRGPTTTTSSSHRYFSRLSRRFFASPNNNTNDNKPQTTLNPGQDPKPNPLTNKPQTRHHQTNRIPVTPQRLCSLKRKSNSYFAAQARNLLLASPESLPEPLESATDVGALQGTHALQGTLAHARVLRDDDDDMGNQVSTGRVDSSTPPDDDSSTRCIGLGSKPETEMGFIDAAGMERSGTATSVLTTNRSKAGIDLESSAGRFLPGRPAAAAAAEGSRTTAITTTPCAARDNTNRKDVAIADPIISQRHPHPHLSLAAAVTTTTSQSSSGRRPLPPPQSRDAVREAAKRAAAEIVDLCSSDNDEARPRMPAKRARKGAVEDGGPMTGVEGVEGVTVKTEEEGPGIGVLPGVDLLQPEDGSSGCVVTGGALSESNSGRLDQERFRKTLDNMFVDEGYGSLPVPDDDNDNEDGDDQLPENEDDLMKRINDSLGLSSPFVQKRKDKVQKPLSQEQVWAQRQQRREVEESRRMRKANLAAKRQEPRQVGDTRRRGGLSVGFLEDEEESRRDGVGSVSMTAQKTLAVTRSTEQEVARRNVEPDADLSMVDPQVESQAAEHKAQPTRTLQATPTTRRKRLDRRTQYRLEAAIPVLSSLGFPASVLEGETNREIIRLGMKYQVIPPTQEEVQKKIAKLVAKHNARPKPSPNTAAITARSRPEKPPSDKVAAAEATLRDMGLTPSVTADWTYQKKIQWAAVERRKRELEDAIARHKAREKNTSRQIPPTEQQKYNSQSAQGVEAAAADISETDESEEEDGWEYAIWWAASGQPKTLADTMPSQPVATKPDITPEEPESEAEENEVETLEEHAQQDHGPVLPITVVATPGKYSNRQAPDPDLLRQMQQRNLDDWSDEKGDEQVYEYVVKADTWGMPGLPAHDLLILGRFLDRDKAEELVRDTVSRCKPVTAVRSLEIQSVWSNGNFSQKITYDGEAGCRAYVEPELVPARKYPDLTQKVARRKSYAVLFKRTISRSKPDGDDAEVEEDVEATTIDDMQVFTTKSLANWEAKRVYLAWHEQHLNEPEDKCWLMTLDEDLRQQVRELNDEGLLFGKKDDFMKDGATDTMNVRVREIAPKGPRN